MDVNPLFVNDKGNLSMDYSGDGCHLQAKPCQTMAEWIIEQTKKFLGL